MEGNEYLKWDIQYKNGDGDTAFHVAISKDADIDILKALLEKGVNVNVKTNYDKTPFECLNHGSWQTATNLLKLEKEFDLTDNLGNTFLHVLMGSVWEDFESEQEEMIEKFWNNILENVEQFAINLNTQNDYGCTVLHKATEGSSLKSLEVMLSHFEHVDPFIRNDNGDNFLHKYFLGNRLLVSTHQFQDKMIKGELKYLPKQTLTKLLSSQNNDKNTPLHIHIKVIEKMIKAGADTVELDEEISEYGNDYRDEYFPETTVMEIEDILEAGADPNIGDRIGDTALHCIFKKYINPLEEDTKEQDEISESQNSYRDKAIQCFVKHGADVNATNQRGESPIFLATHEQHIKTLMNLGADINMQNRLLQTPLLYFVSKKNVNLNTLENLLQEGANVFAADIHGNTVLHYIAWHGYHRNFLPALKKYKVKATQDNLGQLPCDVAYIQGHKAIFDEVCDCKKDTHSEQEHFNLTNEVINLTSLLKTPDEYQEKFDRIRNFRGNQMSKVLSLPGMGAVDFEGEAADIKAVAKEIVKSICAKLTEKNNYWKCRIIQSGSVGENTKVDSPNEFDFVIIFEKFGQVCIVDEEQQSGVDQVDAYLILKPEDDTEESDDDSEETDDGEYYYDKWADNKMRKDLFSIEKYLDTSERLNIYKVRHQLSDIINAIDTTQSLFQHPNISNVESRTKTMFSPTIKFSFIWNGCMYKKLLVDIDIVPACQVKGWWPDNCNIDGLQGDTKLLKEQGAILLFQSKYGGDVMDYKLRVSAMSAEKEHMLHLPQVARDAYEVCKILCNDRICPQLQVNSDRPKKKVVTSYMLKTALFHTMDDMETSQRLKTEPTKKEKLKLDKNFELSNIVRNIFLKLLKFTKEENLPSFVFPRQNVFPLELLELNHSLCAFRYCFIKIILAMLGEKQDFSDIDEKSCSQAVYRVLGSQAVHRNT